MYDPSITNIRHVAIGVGGAGGGAICFKIGAERSYWRQTEAERSFPHLKSMQSAHNVAFSFRIDAERCLSRQIRCMFNFKIDAERP